MQASQSLIKILLINDHSMMRHGLSSLLGKEQDFIVEGEADSAETALQMLENIQVDVALVDLSRQDLAGPNCVRVLQEVYPKLAILAVSHKHQNNYITAMIRAGAKGILFTQSDSESLLLGIRALAGGAMYFSAEIRPSIEDVFQGNISKKSPPGQTAIDLTPREAEVLQLIIQERTTAEIASELSISTRTVDTHRRNLILKTGVRNTAGLVRFSLENNLY